MKKDSMKKKLLKKQLDAMNEKDFYVRTIVNRLHIDNLRLLATFYFNDGFFTVEKLKKDYQFLLQPKP